MTLTFDLLLIIKNVELFCFFFNFFRHDNNDADSSTAYTKYDRSKIPKRCAKLPDLTNDYPNFSIHLYFGIGNSMNINYLF